MMLIIKIICVALATVYTTALEQLPEKDIYITEPNRMGLNKKNLDHVPHEFPEDAHFRYEPPGLKKPPPKHQQPRQQNRRGDVYYVVPSNQQQKPRQPKRPHHDYMTEIMKDYPNHDHNHHGEYLSDIGFPPRSKPKPNFDYFSQKYDDVPKFQPPQSMDYESDDHKYGSKFEPIVEPKYGSKFEPISEPKYIPKYEHMSVPKHVYGHEEPEEESKHKDDLGRYEHYEPYEPKRRQPVRPTFQRSYPRDEPRTRHSDFGYYMQESVEVRKPKRPQVPHSHPHQHQHPHPHAHPHQPPPPPPPPHGMEELDYESCDCGN